MSRIRVTGSWCRVDAAQGGSKPCYYRAALPARSTGRSISRRNHEKAALDGELLSCYHVAPRNMACHATFTAMHVNFTEFLVAFSSFPSLQQRLQRVLASLPAHVQQDFLSDRSFQITLEEFTPGQGWTLFMSLPKCGQSVSRCVVLREKLDRAPESFALYIIAHEFAHAFLRNGGWGDITDKEEAADALAASWGYPKPRLRWF